MQFYRIAHQTVGSGLVVRYREIGTRGDLEISVSREGVVINRQVRPTKDVQDLLVIINRAAEWLPYLEEGRIRSDDVAEVPIANEPQCVIETRRARMGQDDIILENRKP